MAEDYTTPFLVSAFFVVFIALFIIWAAWGILAALFTGWLADTVMRHLRRTDQ